MKEDQAMKRLMIAALAVIAVATPALAAEHYAVIDTEGNCAVLDARPSGDLKILGNAKGYDSHASAKQVLKGNAQCKGYV
jgi:hypothetical protein